MPPPSPTAAHRAIIRTVGLTKVYAGSELAAVDGLDLDVEPGEIFGLLGPNGAGQDHHGRHADHPGHPHRRSRHSSAASTWWPIPPWPSRSSGSSASRTPWTDS